MLLKWRQKEQNLGVVLTNLSHISGEEVVKFLQDTLDCLFDILNTNSDMYGEKVFDVLVSYKSRNLASLLMCDLLAENLLVLVYCGVWRSLLNYQIPL